MFHPTLSQLLKHVQSEDGAGLQSAVVAALQRFAGGQFDRLTQSHAVAALMQNMSGTSAEEYSQQLISSFITGTPVGEAQGPPDARQQPSDEHDADAGGTDTKLRVLTGRRTWAVEQLCGACDRQAKGGAGSRDASVPALGVRRSLQKSQDFVHPSGARPPLPPASWLLRVRSQC